MVGAWRRGVVFSLLIALGVALVACGGDAGKGGGFSTETVAQQVQVAADPSGALRWDRGEYEANAGNSSFVVEDARPLPHQFTLAGNGASHRSETLASKTTQTPTVRALPPGEYQIICDYPGHKAAGMVAKLIVR